MLPLLLASLLQWFFLRLAISVVEDFLSIEVQKASLSVWISGKKAPKSAWRDMYVDTSGKITRDILRGHKSAGVPGTVAGLIETHRKYGKLELKDVIQPAVETAYNGFVVDRKLDENLHDYEKDLREFTSSLKVFTKNGELYREGDTLRLPDLGATLERIRDTKGRDFYFGKTADLIVDEMKKGRGINHKK